MHRYECYAKNCNIQRKMFISLEILTVNKKFTLSYLLLKQQKQKQNEIRFLYSHFGCEMKNVLNWIGCQNVVFCKSFVVVGRRKSFCLNRKCRRFHLLNEWVFNLLFSSLGISCFDIFNNSYVFLFSTYYMKIRFFDRHLFVNNNFIHFQWFRYCLSCYVKN